MPANSSVFPAFVKAEYQPGGFAAFERDAEANKERISSIYRAAFTEIKEAASSALSRGLNSAGAVDLGVREYQQAAREARAFAEASKMAAEAAHRVGAAQASIDPQMRAHLKALRDEAEEAKRSADELQRRANYFEGLQSVIDRTTRSATAATAAFRELFRGQADAARDDAAGIEMRRRFDAHMGVRAAPRASERATRAAGLEQAFAEAEEAEQAWKELARRFNDSSPNLQAPLPAAWAAYARELKQTDAAAKLAKQSLIDAKKAADSAFGQALTSAERFEENLVRISDLTKQALMAPRNQFGALDFNVNGARQRAQSLHAEAIAAREVATALERVSRAEREYSQDARLAVVAAHAAALSKEEDARAATRQVAALEQLQTEMNQTRSATQMIVRGNQQIGESSRASRFAMVMVGQQAQDMAIQLQAGVPAQQIFVQQVSQMGFALSQMEGRLGRVGRFLTGGWGTALFLGVAAAGYLISALRTTRDETEQAVEATEGFSRAQSALGQIFDLTTGRLRDQSGALAEHIDLMRLQIEVTAAQLELEARRDQRRARELFREGMEPTSVGETIGSILGRRGASSPSERLRQREAIADEQRNLLRNIQTAQGRLDQATGDAERAAARQALETARRTALRASERPGFGVGYGISAEEFQEAVLTDATGRANQEIARRTRESLDRGRLDPAFRQRGRGGDRSREIETLREFGRDAADRLAGLSGDFADTPRAMDRARGALREIDDLYGDILTKNERLRSLTGQGFANFDELTRSANEARQAIREGVVRQLTEDFRDQPRLVERVRDALQGLEEAQREFGTGNEALMQRIREGAQLAADALERPYRDFLEDQLRSFDVQQLMVQGREDEAQALQIIHRLEEQMGPIGEERRQVILDSTRALYEQARALEIIRERQGLYLRAADEVRGSIADLLSNPQAGIAGIGDFFVNLNSTFSRLRGELLTERLFGGMFRQLEDYVTGRDRVRTANEDYAQTMGNVRDVVAELGGAQQNQIPIVNEVTDALRRLGAQAEDTINRMAAAPGAVEPAIETVVGSQLRDDRGGRRFRSREEAIGMVGRELQALGLLVGENVQFGGVRGRHTYAQHGRNAIDINIGRGNVESADPVMRRMFNEMALAYQARGFRILWDGQIYEPRGSGPGRPIPRGRVGDHRDHMHMEAPASIVGRLAGANDNLATASSEAATALASTTDRLAFLTGILADLDDAAAGAPASTEGVQPDIEVTAPVAGARLNPREFIERLITGVATPIFGRKVGEAIGRYLPQALEGATYGRMASNMILGRSGSSLGSQIGGAAGGIGGKVAERAINASLASMGQMLIPGIAGPLGSIMGGLAGSVLASALKSTPRASSTIGVGADGRLVVASTTGSKRLRGASVEAADSAIATIERLAEALGGSVLSGVGSVSIGMRKGSYRVDPSGKGITKTKKGAIDFGEDAEAAVRAATLDLIKDGIIGGLRASTQRLLQGAKDLDAGIAKAVKFESVFQRLKEHLDPMGAALDVLDKEFSALKRIFDEAGASAEEYAELEKLYALDRKRVLEETTSAMTSALRGLLDDLTVNNDALSLRDRLAMAKAKYDPLAADVAAGKKVDYDAFAEAARTFLEIQRQLSGSQQGYFSALDEVTGLTKKAISDQENIISIGTGRATPFDKPSGAVNDNAPVVGAIDRLGDILVRELGGRLDALNANTARALSSGGGGGGGGREFPAFSRIRNF